MADAFGFQTPTEVALALRKRLQERRERLAAVAQQGSTEFRAGVGAGQIVGGIGRLFGSKPSENPLVTKAKQIQEAQRGILEEEQKQIAQGVHEDWARAQSLRSMADRLASAGLHTEADQMRVASAAKMKEFRNSSTERSQLKADLASSQAEEARQADEFASEGDVFYLPGEQRLESVPVSDPERRAEIREQGGFEFTPGAFEVSLGPEDVGFTTKTQGSLEDQIISSSNSLDRLGIIESSFEPVFQTFAGRVAADSLNKLDKLSPSALAKIPGATDFLERFTNFRTVAFDNMNRYIKEITGAQMSEVEANRLRKAIPDPERDGPTQFVSKMQTSTRVLEAAEKRAMHFLNKGFREVPLDEDDAAYIPLENFMTTTEETKDTGEETFEEKKARLLGE